jgi:hypothetical protein
VEVAALYHRSLISLSTLGIRRLDSVVEWIAVESGATISAVNCGCCLGVREKLFCESNISEERNDLINVSQNDTTVGGNRRTRVVVYPENLWCRRCVILANFYGRGLRKNFQSTQTYQHTISPKHDVSHHKHIGTPHNHLMQCEQSGVCTSRQRPTNHMQVTKRMQP